MILIPVIVSKQIKIKNIIRQNKKGALLEFLFGSENDRGDSFQSLSPSLKEMEKKIKNLQNQVNSLEARICDLEITRDNSKYPLSEPSHPSESSKTIQQGDSTIDSNKGSYSAQNHTPIHTKVEEPILKTASDTSKIDFKTRERSEQYNIQFKPQNNSNFITFGKISEDEKIEIIKLGFQLQAESKISLKKYYENTDPNSLSLFQLKGYRIKYESIRRTKPYQQLKP